MIGVTLGDETKVFKPGPMEAVKLSVERNWESSGLIFRTLGGLFTGSTSVRQLQDKVARGEVRYALIDPAKTAPSVQWAIRHGRDMTDELGVGPFYRFVWLSPP